MDMIHSIQRKDNKKKSKGRGNLENDLKFAIKKTLGSAEECHEFCEINQFFSLFQFFTTPLRFKGMMLNCY
jgi:hypothetical protein